jgi:hypothetical protein
MVGLPLLWDNPPVHDHPGGQPLFASKTPVIHPRLAGGNSHLLETLHNPREYLQEALLPNPTLGGTCIITH